MSRRHPSILSLTLLLALALAPIAEGQSTGRIDGRVVDDAGKGLGGVAVIVNELGSTTLTDASGRFAFTGLAAGSYVLSFSLGDNATTESVSVAAGKTTTVTKTVDWDISFAETITVVSASRRSERIVEAPAAVTVVTEAEIGKQASHGQLPKLLEFTPGAEVTQSGLYDYNFNTRGFNSSLTRRVATLIDGRDVSVPFLGSQEWAAVSFPLDDIENLEMVRGPSAALYGANASSGVLNMVTKAPRTSVGGVIRLTGGELSTFNLDFRVAGDLGGDWYYKANGGLRDTGDFTVSRNGAAEYAVPCTLPGQTDCLPQEAVPLDPEDDNQIFFGGLRFDKHFANSDVLTVEAGQASIEGPGFQTGIGRVQLRDVERPWFRANYNSAHWNFLGSYAKRDASDQVALSSGNRIPLDTDRTTFEVQTNWDFAGSKARIVGGVSWTEENIDSFEPLSARQTLVFEPINNKKSALFAQLDWELSDHFKLVLAGRADDNDLHDTQFSPKAAVVYSINPNNTLRFTYNEAFQVANYSEFFLHALVASFPGDPLNGVCFQVVGQSCGLPAVIGVYALGNATLELEEVKSFEVGYSGIFSKKAFLTIDYYSSENSNFITDLIPQINADLGGRTNPNFGPLAGVPAQLSAVLDGVLGMFIPGAALTNDVDGTPIIAAVSYTNFGDVDTQGIDVGLNYYVNREWTVNFAYSWFDFDIKGNAGNLERILLPNSPENKVSAGLAYVGRNFDWNVSARWVDDFRWAVGPFQGDVEAYTTVDLGFNYQLTDQWKIGINVANALDDEHWESFGGDLLGRRALANVQYSW